MFAEAARELVTQPRDHGLQAPERAAGNRPALAILFTNIPRLHPLILSKHTGQFAEASLCVSLYSFKR